MACRRRAAAFGVARSGQRPGGRGRELGGDFGSRPGWQRRARVRAPSRARPWTVTVCRASSWRGDDVPARGTSGYARLRDELAASGLVVVGVEFRNAPGALGNHSSAAGLEDCAAAVRWAGADLDELGGTHLVVSGDSDGGNLSLAVAITALKQGWLEHISGVYAQCPWAVSGAYKDRPMTSLRRASTTATSSAGRTSAGRPRPTIPDRLTRWILFAGRGGRARTKSYACRRTSSR
jgi:hypothetical protein